MRRAFFGILQAKFDVLRGPRETIRAAMLSLFIITTWLMSPSLSAQSNEWVWVNGPETPQPAVYGTMGTPATGNLPGARYSAVTWPDADGDLWLFGGQAFDSTGRSGDLNDLWKYRRSTNEWIWMGGSNISASATSVYGTLGVPAAGNIPAGREDAVSWTDSQGNFWLFGGSNYFTGTTFLNDLWRFSPATGQWTWMAGSNSANQAGVYGTQGVPALGNAPGSRLSAVTWVDSHGGFWLFGGWGYDANGAIGQLNDLWRFSPSTNEWTWMAGSSTLGCGGSCGQSGVYGVKGTPSVSNVPGGRYRAFSWTDNNGNLWLFGGLGSDSAGTSGLLNDLWVFSPSSNEWAWMGGSNTYPSTCTTPETDNCGAPGNYGMLQVPAAGNLPGARESGVTWTDEKGNLWLFGGDGIDSSGDAGYLNDLWEYVPSSNEWEWMSGSNTVICAYPDCGQPGVYNAFQIPDLANAPSGRFNAMAWTDTEGDLWLFGGYGMDVAGVARAFNDLWEFQPNTVGLPIAAAPVFSPSSGTYTTPQMVTITDATPGATIQYLLSGSTQTAEYTSPILLASSQTIEAIASTNGYANSAISTATYTIQISPTATPVFSLASGTYAATQIVMITDATAGSTIYYTTDGSLPTTNSAVYSGPLTVSSSEVIQAVAIASGLANSALASAVYTIGSNSTLGEWAFMGGSSGTDRPGVYGTFQVPSTANIPGAREGAVSWTDQDGNLWLFGGSSESVSELVEGSLSDLWRFNPSTQEWTWMAGPNLIDQPGVYGTMGTASSSNTPGGRWGATGWTDDAGRLWLFGGYGLDSVGNRGELNDLWVFDPATLQWTWINGSNQGVLSFYASYGQPGVYGVLGVPAPGNVPGSRYDAVSWVDKNGNFWIFGGTGQDFSGDSVVLNDLWEFNPSTGQWAWMSGSNLVDVLTGFQIGVYGTLGTPAPDNVPGSRTGAAAWTGDDGNLWLFGGQSATSQGYFNDLWKYIPSSKQWVWMNGASGPYCHSNPTVGENTCSSQPGVYGTLGVPAAGNTPAGGSLFANWKDQQGNFWLFGGWGSDITGQDGGFYLGALNTLWVFNPQTNQWAWMGGDYATSNCSWIVSIITFPLCDGAPGYFATPAVPAAANVPGSRKSSASWTDKNGNLWLFSGAVTDAVDIPGVMNDLWEYQPSLSTVPAAATPIFSLKSGSYGTDGPLMLSNGMANASIYYTTDGSLPTTSSNLYTAPITIVPNEVVHAFATAPGYRNSGFLSEQYTLPPTPAPPTFSSPSGTYTSVQTIAISDTVPSAEIFYTTDGTVPVPSSPAYAGPITVSSSETINALGVTFGYGVAAGIAIQYGGQVVGPDASATYTLNLPPAATPTFSLPSGTYSSAQTLTITDATAGATIYYTTDGTTPTMSSPQYFGPIAISRTETIQAIATSYGYSNSSVASGAYTINLPGSIDFSLSLSPASLTVNSGSSATVSVMVTPINGVNQVVSFECLGLPATVSCSFSPSQVTPGPGAATTVLTIAATGHAAIQVPGRVPWVPVTSLALIVGCFTFGRRRSYALRSLLVVASVALLYMTACGGGGGGSGTPASGSAAATSTITIQASNGIQSHSQSLTLTIN